MDMPEVHRLEQLWSGPFGDAYILRNPNNASERRPFWKGILEEFPSARVLEFGCNIGSNLHCLAEWIPPGSLYAVDVNCQALSQLRQTLPGANVLRAAAREVPFRDNWFDLTFTTGVLIHQPEDALPLVMAEMVRCSRKYLLCGEYFAETLTEVGYRGQSGALFKRDYGTLFQELFPGLILRKRGFLDQSTGWDDVTYWVFEKP